MCKRSREVNLYGGHSIHRTGVYTGASKATIPDWVVELAGWYLTDGSADTKYRSPRFIRGVVCERQAAIAIQQSVRGNPHKVKMIERLMRHARRTERVSCSTSKGPQLRIWTVRGRLARYFQEMFPGRVLTTRFMVLLTTEQLHLLHATMFLGNGTKNSRAFCAGSKRRADAYQMLSVLCGRASNAHARDFSAYTPKKYPSMGNIPKPTKPCWNVNVLNRTRAQIQNKDSTVVHVRNHRVWCPMVPNGFFVARREGTVYITGNTLIQSKAADLISFAIVDIVKWIVDHKVPAKVITSVYDSIMIEAKRKVADEVLAKLVETMLHHGRLHLGAVPYVVDASRGPSWGSLEKAGT